MLDAQPRVSFFALSSPGLGGLMNGALTGNAGLEPNGLTGEGSAKNDAYLRCDDPPQFKS